ncbi:hypothetical protein M1446_03585 [Candidatus Dependentiae bacterium]|nr:hypothetical protein [Candidatus Dependentiae bacterium]
MYKIKYLIFVLLASMQLLASDTKKNEFSRTKIVSKIKEITKKSGTWIKNHKKKSAAIIIASAVYLNGFFELRKNGDVYYGRNLPDLYKRGDLLPSLVGAPFEGTHMSLTRIKQLFKQMDYLIDDIQGYIYLINKIIFKNL